MIHNDYNVGQTRRLLKITSFATLERLTVEPTDNNIVAPGSKRILDREFHTLSLANVALAE